MLLLLFLIHSFFFNDPPTTEIYTLSLHDALPISATFRRASPAWWRRARSRCAICHLRCSVTRRSRTSDRKSTRLNSSHVEISYAVFCLKKKKSEFSIATQPHDSVHAQHVYASSAS